MVDSHYLETILKLLKSHDVKEFKTQGLELLFHAEQEGGNLSGHSGHPTTVDNVGTQDPDNSTQIIADTIKKQEEALPVDLRADSLMDQNKILNWSSPDQDDNQSEMPLTDEQPL